MIVVGMALRFRFQTARIAYKLIYLYAEIHLSFKLGLLNLLKSY